MPGFYNPFSPKPDWGGGIQELLGNLAQMIMIKKMGEPQGRKLPGAQSPMPMPQPQLGVQGAAGPNFDPTASTRQKPMPMGQPQTGLQGPLPPQGPLPSTQGTGGVLGGKDIQALASSMPPEIMQIILKLLEQGKFTTPGVTGGR